MPRHKISGSKNMNPITVLEIFSQITFQKSYSVLYSYEKCMQMPLLLPSG